MAFSEQVRYGHIIAGSLEKIYVTDNEKNWIYIKKYVIHNKKNRLMIMEKQKAFAMRTERMDS